MEDWAEIRRLHTAEGVAIKAIVRKTGISRNAVRRALSSDSPIDFLVYGILLILSGWMLHKRGLSRMERSTTARIASPG